MSPRPGVTLMAARSRSGGLLAAIQVLVVVLASSCQTYEAYGRSYGQSSRAIAGVPPLVTLTERHAAIAPRREAALGAPLVRELEGCELLRAQLAHGSRAATSHVACVWGCPLAWPFDLLSLLQWPLGETRKAQAVWAEAERLERAYQADTQQFLAVCRDVKQTEVGRAFTSALVAPALRRSPALPPSPPSPSSSLAPPVEGNAAADDGDANDVDADNPKAMNPPP